MRDFTANIYIEGEYDNDLYELQAVEEALRDWALGGYIPEEDIDMVSIREVLVSGGAVWQ